MLLANGLEYCTCPKVKCKRYGNCGECAAYHKANKKFDPYCMREQKTKNKKKDKD